MEYGDFGIFGGKENEKPFVFLRLFFSFFGFFIASFAINPFENVSFLCSSLISNIGF